MKRKWSSTADPVDLGLSRSALMALDSVESALEVVKRASADTQRGGIAQAGVGLTGVLGGMGDTRVGGAAAGLAAVAFPDVRANAAAALGKQNMDLAGEGFKGILGERFKDIAGVASAKDLMLGKASSPYPVFNGLSDLFEGASSLSSTFKAADLAGTIPKKPATFGLSAKMLRVANLSAVRSAASLLGARTRTDSIIASAWEPRWEDDHLLASWKGTLLSNATSGLPGRLWTAGAIKDSGALRYAMGLSGTDWLYGPPRELGLLGKFGAASGLCAALPVFDASDAACQASKWNLGGLIENLGLVDFDALRKAAERGARVRKARRPRATLRSEGRHRGRGGVRTRARAHRAAAVRLLRLRRGRLLPFRLGGPLYARCCRRVAFLPGPPSPLRRPRRARRPQRRRSGQ